MDIRKLEVMVSEETYMGFWARAVNEGIVHRNGKPDIGKALFFLVKAYAEGRVRIAVEKKEAKHAKATGIDYVSEYRKREGTAS